MASDLDRLVADIRACRICRDAPRGRQLAHEPRPVVRVAARARIAICGQAPGVRVHNSGLPFDDASGDRLRDWMGVDRTTFYDEATIAFVPMGFCFPGHDAKKSDLPPRRECAAQWRAQVMAQLPKLELVLLIGQYAQSWHLARIPGLDDLPKSLTATVTDWRRIYDHSRQLNSEPRTLVLPHPSWRNSGWLKRHPWFTDDLLPVLREEVGNLVGSPTDNTPSPYVP
jgi:uracil-DNA glycosylase